MASKTNRSTSIIEEEEENHYYGHGGGGGGGRVDNLYQLIEEELSFLEESFQETKRRADQLIVQIKDVRCKSEQLRRRQGRTEIETELRELKKTVSKLKSKIPFNLITPEDVPNPNVNRRPRINPNQKPRKPLADNGGLVGDNLLLLMDNGYHPTSEHLLSSLRDLTLHCSTKHLLLCFLVFPESAFLKKSLLGCFFGCFLRSAMDDIYPRFETYSTDLEFNQTIDELISKGFIESDYKNCSRTVSGFSMPPFVRSTLRNYLSTIWEGVRCFLVNSIYDHDDEEDDIIYNGSAEVSTMKDLQFLHMGNWKKSSTRHIEMEDPQLFFKYTKNMQSLHYISFRRVSMMTELPGFISNLKSLECLDLKACHNLEVIPSDIGNLRWCLTYLDMSECYFLDHMPASLSQLTRLRVLKGFFVGETNHEDSCTLQDLSALTDLIKLNIYTSVKTFPNEDQFTALQGFECLRKLTISWGGCVTSGKKDEPRSVKSPTFHTKIFSSHDLPPVEYSRFKYKKVKSQFKLKKLDLQCVPEKVAGNWFRASNFKHLERLYIRGGKFEDLEHFKDEEWSVEILRLKHLSKLQMDWSELVNLFPKMVSVEKVDCPNLTSFPCDDCGLWTNTTQTPATM